MPKLLATVIATFVAVAGITLAPPAAADEKAIAAAVEKVFSEKPQRVTKTEYMGLYEVYVGGQIIYTDEKASAFMLGQLIDGKTLENVTGKRNFALLPYDLAIKQVRGNGKATLVTFEDPKCGYCKKLARDLATLKDATIYTFLMPILSQDSIDKSRAIWCAKDRAKAWNDWMVDDKTPTAPGKDCQAPIEQLVQLGQANGVQGTPTILFADGGRAPGAVPIAQIEERLARIGRK